MPPPRTAVAILHPPHKPSRVSVLSARHTRPLSTCTSFKRPQAPSSAYRPLHSQQSVLCFSTTCSSYAREQNYYEILDLPTTATAPEIKKQFYALCLRHHPDHNRKDPEASQKFARLSAAYNTLRNATKRAAYDRQHGIHNHQAHPTGSHSSHTANPHKGGHGSYAGSRPASGLSKQRGTFTGPPPSFYAQGGYGATGRRAEGGYTGTGFGFGDEKAKESDPEDPMGFIYRNPLGHFNARSHFRTQSAEDRRRGERRRAAQRAAMKEGDFLRAHGGGHIDFAMVFTLIGIIFGVVTIGGMMMPRETTAAGMVEAMEAARRKELKEKAGPSSN